MQTEQNLNNLKTNGDKSETIKELADRHLADQSHQTSDEEFRNARIVTDEVVTVQDESLFEIDNTTVIPPLPGEEEATTKEFSDEDHSSRRPPNPYDILK